MSVGGPTPALMGIRFLNPRLASRSDGLKVAVGLQPTGSDARRRRCVALATPETALLLTPTRHEPSEPSSVADATHLGLDGAGPWAEAARLSSCNRYAIINWSLRTAVGLEETTPPSKRERDQELGLFPPVDHPNPRGLAMTSVL